MQKTSINSVCIRCDKTRVFSKKWKDKENDRGPVITHEISVCPDAACQKIVDQKFQDMKDKRDQAEERRKNTVRKPTVAAAS